MQNLATVFRDATDPILIEDLDGIVIDLNDEAVRTYGFARSELVGWPIKAIVPPQRHQQADELLQRCRSGETVRNVEGLRLTKDGQLVPVLLSLSLLKDDAGIPTAVATFAKDISNLKEAEKKSKELAEQLEARVRQRTAEIEETSRRLTHELAVARELSNAANREHEAMLLGDSIAVRSLRESIRSFGDDSDPLLLTGPSGAGYEAIARAIHHASDRASRHFIYVDVASAAMTDTGLFDTRDGADSQQWPSKAMLADGGTLFLQGIDRLSKDAQARLLEFLTAAATSRRRGDRPRPDVRVVACTSTDLTEESLQGRFHSELEQLLGRRRLAIPSLAERRDDIIPIAKQIIQIRAASVGKVIEGLAPHAADSLRGYSWPGNVKELQSVLERAVVLTQSTRLDVPTELLREGPRLGSYTLVRKLGSGAMGEVWLASHALLARPAAVKLIRQQALDVESQEQHRLRVRFQREARATAALRSPYTVELYDFGVSQDGNFFYVMEYLTGIDLHRLVDEYGPLPPARAIHLIRQACLSLAEAHEAGLVHRDIKPSNLLTCSLGGVRDILKVLDFGVVRVTKGQDQFVTATGQITGTPACMAPELMDGSRADATADIYGLGCVAYRLLTGRNVFSAPTVMALMMHHATTAPDPPSKHNPSVPKELDEVILQCLKKNPVDRMDSVITLRESLAAVPLAREWTEQDAAAWWDENMPETTEAEVTENGMTVRGKAASETVKETADEDPDKDFDCSS